MLISTSKKGPGGVTRFLKCLPGEHEDLILVSSVTQEKPGDVIPVAHTGTVPGTHWPASLTELASFRPVRDPVP